MRIVTLLPAATEIVCALGAGEDLVGISHECDHPESVVRLPRVTASGIDASRPSGSIDAAVRQAQSAGTAAIVIDATKLSALRPDVVITQSLCNVCAASGESVAEVTARLDRPVRVVTLAGRTVAGIMHDIETVGSALGRDGEAGDLVATLSRRLTALSPLTPRASQAVGIPRVACVEWLDPLYLAGHWVPDLVAAAGGEDVGAAPGSHSRRSSWSEVERLRADVVVVMLCGFGIDRARRELDALTDPDARAFLASRPVWVLDGHAFTSRPGPRIVDAAERLRSAFRGRPADGLVRHHLPT